MNKKRAFTTAELVIAIAVLGVLAVMLMPNIIYSTQNVVFRHSRKINTQKIAQGITMLAMRNNRMNYDSNSAFIKDYQKYTKLLRSCSQDKIAECWPHKIHFVSANKESEDYTPEKIMTAMISGMDNKDPYGKPAIYLVDATAFVTINGVPVMISYNRNCNPNVSDENKSCYIAIIDSNGEKAPNELGRDIVLINARKLQDCENGSALETSGTAQARSCKSIWAEGDED